MRITVETVTPQIAAEMLATSTGNRTLKRKKVEAYARDMKAGKWTLNGETVIFNSEGVLLDGHHRLNACITSGAEVQLTVVRGVPESARKTIDTGAARSVGDAMLISGISNSNHVVSVINIVHSLINGRPRSSNMSATEAFEFYKKHQADLDQAAVIASRKVLPRVTAVVGAIYFIAKRMAHEDKFDKFFYVLKTGIASGPNCPALALRDRMFRDASKRTPMTLRDAQIVTVAAWEKFRNGDIAGNLRVGDKFQVKGFKL